MTTTQASTVLLLLTVGVTWAAAGPAQAQAQAPVVDDRDKPPGEIGKEEATRYRLMLDGRVTPLPDSVARQGPKMIALDDGRLLSVRNGHAVSSSDDGVTWEDHGPILKDVDPKQLRINAAIQLLFQTAKGNVLLLFVNQANFRFKWDAQTNNPAGELRADVWGVRSADGGRTWGEPYLVQEGYCGAMQDIIQTRDGRIVAALQHLLYNPGRHAVRTFVSDDDGLAWRGGNILDMGGRGHHDGGFEPTLVELTDGRVWMLIRTNLDKFWSAYSYDGGLYWRELAPSDIDASSSPGHMIRLDSGRLALIWNRLYPVGWTEIPRVSGHTSEAPFSFHREELTIAFSDDDGRTWTESAIVALRRSGAIAYPYLFERRPGELWVITASSPGGRIAFKLQESHLVSK